MRVTRTIRDFENALITLLEKNAFESLTVDQICKEALMHRSSFYRYFSDKYDLLEQTLNAQINKLTENTDSEDDIIKQLLSYIDKNKDVIRHLAPNSARSSLYTEILNILSQVLLERRNLETNDPIVIALQKSDNPEMLAYVLSGAIIGTFYWWQGNNYDVPTEDVIKFARAATKSLTN
ncbi:TetR/AcrR family transcriptional regulator [Limosilactobacillus agrestis]|uniref:TetR/AcrR family transcriptional regulator n=1 Tax=Limosilactobacillus agrestis TaxID=2759748 RepID=A0A7W3UHW8_9LACO|nr:TetR/AcrR family transcriptional regulator [Limosilactobacillus agrestis]MBB1095796.1 TetR/AcrR family transcriptional regulator [Limosilactobacillus agrestis]MBB1098558.1 TetR/AcrR family transcriptional regulator [Limosilactobacillus agrestis]MCD7112076.1 TetR/AcrR family transcriptional regulator [Limosilactobacillus agrestis]MCD7119812.1 TetR/AcrR family transcriptional regulator [Limosilactobacillus agrestis]MCD7125948.1 TetR/AcrR family transcriptional regulator [Limosilactobacillus a